MENAHLKIAIFKSGNDFLELIEYATLKLAPQGLSRCDVDNTHAAFQVEGIKEIRRSLDKEGHRFIAPARHIMEGSMKSWI